MTALSHAETVEGDISHCGTSELDWAQMRTKKQVRVSNQKTQWRQSCSPSQVRVKWLGRGNSDGQRHHNWQLEWRECGRGVKPLYYRPESRIYFRLI